MHFASALFSSSVSIFTAASTTTTTAITATAIATASGLGYLLLSRHYSAPLHFNPALPPPVFAANSHLRLHMPANRTTTTRTSSTSTSTSTRGPATGHYYAVKIGRRPGIYRSWSECNSYVHAFPGAKFKRFGTEAEARAFIDEAPAAQSLKSASRTPYGKPAAHKSGPGRARTANTSRTQSLMASGCSSDAPLAGVQPDGRIVVYTDGASSRNGQKGARAGVGVYFGPDDARNIGEPLAGERQTNQRAELTAIIRALEVLSKSPAAAAAAGVRICTDSMYSINCLTVWFGAWERNGWISSKGTPVENADLIKAALALIRGSVFGGAVSFVHVRGHAGIVGNEMADRLAVQGAAL
ncbi:hypothetical protein GGI07_004585 [Coemansia sp. Benny D115]|nr:hypothetical protein GGI07_004585 [Coemansia sp. Benny D115]